MSDAVPHRHVLVHGSDPLRRRAVARAFAASDVSVLLSSTLAEAAKCLSDNRVGAIVLLDRLAEAHALRMLRPTVPVLWAGAVGTDVDAVAWCEVIDPHEADAAAIVRATVPRLQGGASVVDRQARRDVPTRVIRRP